MVRNSYQLSPSFIGIPLRLAGRTGRPSITFLLYKTAYAWEPDVVTLRSLEILQSFLRQAQRVPVQEMCLCCRLGKHCGQKDASCRGRNFADHIEGVFVRGMTASTEHQNRYSTFFHH